MNITEYVKRLGIEPKSSTASPLDIEAGKTGYNQYLADIESFKKAQEETQASVEASKSWWDKASDFILRANGMSSQMSDNPIASGFNAAVEAYKNIPEDNKPSDDWTDEERWAFGEKYSKDKNDAYSFAKQLNAKKTQEKREKQAKAIEKWTNRNPVNQVLGSAASLGLNATAGSLGFLDSMAQMAGRGEIQQHDILLPHEVAGTMQEAVASDLNKYGTINEKVPILGGKGWGDVYGLGMSILQSKLAATTGGGVGSLAQFFGMSASQGVSDALERGATGGQALAFGTVAGLAEAIPEMISLDKFIGIASSEAVESVFKNVLKMAGEEAGEELTTSLITEVADRWIMGGKSEFQLRVNELVANGMSIEEAKKAAWKQTINNIAFDTLSGAVSGGVSGALGTGINRFNQRFLQTEANETAKKALTPEQDNLIAEAKKYDSTKKRASALEKKTAEGKELSGYDLRMLANQVNEASRNADVDTARKAIVERMKAEGLDDTQAKRLGEIALNKAIGNEISKVQELMLKRNPAAMKVYSQMSEEMMQSGLGDSEWAKNTPIEKLRAQNNTSVSERDTEQRVQSGIERLKADIASRYGVDTKEYKINMDSIEGKFGEIENKIVYKPGENSKIHVDGISSSLTQDDIVELSAVEKIANELGIDIHVYETKADKKTGERVYTDKNGKRYSDSGFYDPSDNSIHIDLRAGENGEGTMLYTASHEVVHFIKENAPEHYAALEELVTKELIQGGFSIDTLIEEQRKILRKNGWSGKESDFEAVAREEMVAEACQSFLASKNAVAEIKALKTENKGLWNALKKFFTSLFAKISNVYKTVPPDSAQGKYIADMRKAVKPIRDAFMEGAVEAAKKSASGNKTKVETAENKTVKSKARVTSEQDTAYLDAVKRGDMETAQKLVDEAAKANGYTDKLYHGTQQFGFTEFDPSYSDDKISIFAAGSPEIAQTYSGKNNTKKISDKVKIDNLSNEEVIKRLNKESKESYEGQELQIEYETMNLEDVNKLITEVNSGIEGLQDVLDKKIKEYADRMAIDFDDKDATTHRRLIEAFNLLNAFEYKRLSTPLYVLLHYTDAFEDSPKQIAELEYKIRLMNKLTDVDTSDGVVIKKDLGGYGITVLSFEKAREELAALYSSGNYALYGKPGRQLVIDGKGQTWNNIRNWIRSAYYSTEGTYIKQDDKYYRLYDKKTDEQIFHGRTEINENNSKVPLENMHYIMVQKANNILTIRSEYMKTTRDIAKFAKDEGYDSVKFENIEDNGGRGESVGAGDVYVYFNANDLKSADTITYDDNGNVIPLSERFNTEKKDIRYKARGGETKKASELTEVDLKKLLEKVQNGVYADASYIPLRRNTPEFFIGVVAEHSKGKYVIQNYPMAATVEHLKQNMEEDDGTPYGNHRPHDLSIDDIVTISKKMGDPTYIVLQENGRYAEVVSFYNKRNKKVVVAIDVANSDSKKPKNYKYRQYMNGYDEGYYNIIVTQYEPDSLKDYLSKNTVVYDKNKMNGKYQVGSGRIVTVTHDTPFIDNSIPQSTEDVNTKSEIRHKSRSYTAGQVAAMNANLRHQKVYTKSTAMKFVKAIAPNISAKSFDKLSNELWIGLNTYTSLKDKRDFAKDMADMIVDRMLVDTEVKNRNWDEAVDKIAYLKPAINTIKFREEDLPDLEHMLDKNGLRSLRARWGYKSREGENKREYGLDEFITDLSREMPGMAYLADMHPTEAMVEVDKLYEKLKETIRQRYESAYEDATEEQVERWKSTIEAKIIDVYEYYGGMSRMLQATSSTSEAVDTYLSTVPEGTEKPEKYFVDILKQMDERISYWKAEKSKVERISRWNGIIANKALEIRDFKNGAFLNATQYHPDVFKNSIEELTKVQWRGNISPKGVRKTFAELKKWYTMDNPMLYDKNNKENNDDHYSDAIAFYIDELAADIEKPLSADEYPMIYEVMNHLYTMMKNYGKIFRAGRWVDAADIAKAYIGIIDANDKKRTAWTRAQSLYNRQFLEPMALARQADNYNPNGFFTQTVQELRQASVDASVGEMKLRKEYDEFVNANQKYLMNAAKETVKYRGYDIPKLHLISLYMSMKRKQSREGLALNGFEYTMKTAWWDSEDVIKVPGYLPQSEKHNIDLINRATEEQMKIIAENFTDTDRQYMSILEKLFNEKLREMKIERDMERQGYTNALEGYYYPIIRGGIAKNVDTAKFTDVNRATNSSFNKSTQEHAQQYLKIISADAMVNRHIKDMCKYYYMSQAIENYNVLYQIDTTEGDPNLNNPRNIAERLKVSKIWEKDFDYFKKLVADIQGIRDNKYDSDGWRFIETIRGNYAKFALGLNAKVLFTQISSVIAAGDVIGFGSIMSVNKDVGFVGTKEDIAKYCPIADVRSYEQTALKAMTLSDKLGKVSEKLMIGISVMDDLVVRRLYAACQVEAKKRGEGEIGSEENKIAAGKILEQIIIETQQNSYATEKSSAMRSANPLWRGLTMFTADGMKIISRIHEAVGEFKLAKNNGDTAAIKKARKKLARSIAVAATISVYLAAISTLFNWIYDRDEEDKDDKPIEKVFRFSLDVVGNFIGALPGISDFYDTIVNGFEVEDVAYDTFNNLFGSLANLYKDATDMRDGKDDRGIEDLNRDLRSLLYAVGQVTGMPVRNVYNLARGLVGKVSPKAAYYIDSKFNETSLINDLKKSFQQGNDSKTSYIMSLIYDERLDERVSAGQSKEISRLYEKVSKKEIEGYSILPRDIPDEIKKNGKTYELSDEQKEKIISEYSKVITAIDKLIASSFYLARSDKDKAYMIDYYHDKYYETAVNNALKIKDDKVAVYNAVGFSTYAKFAYATRGIESDKDKNGNTIAGSKKANVIEAIDKISNNEDKKLLYLASLGYSLSDEQKKKLCKYLNSLSISASKKKSLAEICNFTYKKGKIYP